MRKLKKNIYLIGEMFNNRFTSVGQPIPGTLIGMANFSDGNLTPSSIYPNTGWVQGVIAGGQAAIVNGAYRATYPPSPGAGNGAVFSWLNFNFPPNTLEAYITFRAKYTNAFQTKFLKFFGLRDSPVGYANTTYGLTTNIYQPGNVRVDAALNAIIFGDGSATSSDAQNAVYLDGPPNNAIGRSSGTAVVSTPQSHSFDGFADGQWHTFRVHQKFNTGTTAQNEVPDGVIYLEIDGLVYANVTGLFNRHYSNGPMEAVSFGNWSQESPREFELFFDDIKISVGGWPPT